MADLSQRTIRKSRTKRIIHCRNVGLFIAELMRPEFSCFSGSAKELATIKAALDTIETELDDLTVALPPLEQRFDIVNGQMESLSNSMRRKNAVMYKKLTDRIFDTIKKASDYQSVKIRKMRILELKTLLNLQDVVIEDLVDSALSDYIDSLKNK